MNTLLCKALLFSYKEISNIEKGICTGLLTTILSEYNLETNDIFNNREIDKL